MPTITKPSNHFRVVTDTGANIKSACEAVFGDGLYVIKDRANSNNWQWIDYVRGTSAVLQSNTTAAETTYSAPSGNSVGYCWKANGTGVTNTDGSITSTVSANTTAGFSIVTYTGTGANATVGHGLGVAPKFIIVKNRNSAGATDWTCYHSGLTSASYGISLNTTGAQASAAAYWNNTAPTSSVFSVGNGASTNENTKNHVAYCHAEKAGYSKFGSYTGNGSADGPFVWCGFRPRWVLLKRADGVSGWELIDTARSTYNVVGGVLQPQSSGAELFSGDNGNICDVTAGGFKIRSTSSASNTGTVIFAAFAEHPFGGSNCSPSPAR